MGFNSVKHSELDIIKEALIELKIHRRAKYEMGKYSEPGEVERYFKSAKCLDELLGQVQKSIDTVLARNSVEKSDYEKVGVDNLEDLCTFLCATKEALAYRIMKMELSEMELKKTNRLVYRINDVYSQASGTLNRLKNKSHLGEIGLASDGVTEMRIIKFLNENNISVVFPDGRVVERQTYKKFKNGLIETHADYIKRKYG